MIYKCFSCQKPETGKDLLDGYHPKCSKALFGTRRPPSVPFKSTEVTAEAQKMVGRMSVSGVQPKLSVHGLAAELWTYSELAKYTRKYATEEGHSCLAKAVKATIWRILSANEIKPHKIKIRSLF